MPLLARLTLVVAVPVAVLGTTNRTAQDCPSQEAQTQPEEAGITLDWPADQLSRAVRAALDRASYRIDEAASSATTLVTEPLGKRPKRLTGPALDHFRRHAHPWITLTAGFTSYGDDGTQFTLRGQALCTIPPDEPLHDHGSIETAAQVYAVHGVGQQVLEAYTRVHRGTFLAAPRSGRSRPSARERLSLPARSP